MQEGFNSTSACTSQQGFESHSQSSLLTQRKHLGQETRLEPACVLSSWGI